MNAEGFQFERSGQGAFSRGDRELSAQVMQAFVDSLTKENAALTGNISKLISSHFDQHLTGTFPSPPIPATREGAVRASLARARYFSSTLTNELIRIQYNQDRIDEYLVEIHKKYSLPAACLVFVLIGAPLGVMARRGGFGVAATLSLGFFVLYWACLIGGEKLADRGFVTPFWGMWFANVVLAVVGIYLTLRIGKESLVIRWATLQRFVPRAWRPPESELPVQETER